MRRSMVARDAARKRKPLRRSAPRPGRKPRPKPRARRSSAAGVTRCRSSSSTTIDLIGLGARRARRLPRLPAVAGLGRRRGGRRRSSTGSRYAGRRAAPTCAPIGARRGRRAVRPAPGAARGAPVPLRRRSACSPRSTLALAAGTLGLGPARRATRLLAHATSFETAAASSARRSSTAASNLLRHRRRAHPRGLPLRSPALLLLTGASIAGVLRATGTAVADTTRALRAHRGRAAPAPSRAPRPREMPAEFLPPSPTTRSRSCTRTHVEAPIPERRARRRSRAGARRRTSRSCPRGRRSSRRPEPGAEPDAVQLPPPAAEARGRRVATLPEPPRCSSAPTARAAASPTPRGQEQIVGAAGRGAQPLRHRREGHRRPSPARTSPATSCASRRG